MSPYLHTLTHIFDYIAVPGLWNSFLLDVMLKPTTIEDVQEVPLIRLQKPVSVGC
jgi:hypothetical protein